METEERKRCTQCHEWKPLSDFPRSVGYHQGIRSECRKCASKRAMAWQREHPERTNEIDRAYYARNRERETARARERYRLWRAEHPIQPRRRKTRIGADGLRPCSKCGARKAPSAFSPQRDGADGLRPDCKACHSAYVNAKEKEAKRLTRGG